MSSKPTNTLRPQLAGSLGVTEILAGKASRQNDVAALQREDLQSLGHLLLQLACCAPQHVSLEQCAAQCSPELTHIVASLLGHHEPITSWHQVPPLSGLSESLVVLLACICSPGQAQARRRTCRAHVLGGLKDLWKSACGTGRRIEYRRPRSFGALSAVWRALAVEVGGLAPPLFGGDPSISTQSVVLPSRLSSFTVGFPPFNNHYE